MKPRAAAAALLLLACAAARAQDKPVELIDEYVGIRFEPPKGAERLSDEETAREFTDTGDRLKVVFEDPQKTMALIINVFDAEAYGLPTSPASDSQQALRRKLESEVMADVPGAKWISRDVIKVNSLPWLRLRYGFSGVGEMVADQYAIVWGARFMSFTYFSSAVNYERLRADFEKSAASIQLFITVPAGDAPPAVRWGKRKRKP